MSFVPLLPYFVPHVSPFLDRRHRPKLFRLVIGYKSRGSLPWVLRVVCLQSVISGIEVATIPLIGDKGRWLYVPSSASGPLAHAQWFISYPWIVNCNLALSLLFSVQCYCLSSSNGNVKGNSCIISWTFSTASLFFLFQCWIFTRKKVTVLLKTH